MSKWIRLSIALVLATGAIAFLAYAAWQGYRSASLQEAIEANAAALYRQQDDPTGGDPEGDVTVVVFSDYNCPDCRVAEPAIDTLLEQSQGVRFVFKELPIMGPDSVAVARLALAARRQNAYWPLHRALYRLDGRATPARALRLAAKLGLDREALMRDANSSEIMDEIARTRALAEAIGVPGVPFMLVGDQRVEEGADLYEKLEEAVADIRRNGCAAC